MRVDQSDDGIELSALPIEKLGELDALPGLEVVAKMRALLSSPIEDETDRGPLTEALAFIEAPTYDLPTIRKHAEKIGEILAYMMPGAIAEPHVDAMNRHLQTLLCQHYIRTATAELARVPHDLQKIRDAVMFAVDIAKTFAKGYQDDTLLKQALALQKKVEQL